MEPIVLAYMSNPSGYWKRFVNQLEGAGIDYAARFDEEFSWRRMILWQGEMGAAHPDRLCIFVGGWDTLLMGDRQEILDFKVADDEIVFSGDKVCWPDYREGEYRRRDGHGLGPWCYLNPGPMSAKGSLVAEVVEWGMEHHPLTVDDKDIAGSASGTDMRFWTDVYLLSPFRSRIDYKCEFGQTALHESEGDFSLIDSRIRNNVHRTYPIFLHLNGKIPAPGGLK